MAIYCGFMFVVRFPKQHREADYSNNKSKALCGKEKYCRISKYLLTFIAIYLLKLLLTTIGLHGNINNRNRLKRVKISWIEFQ